MSSIVPVVTTTLGTNPELLAKITSGLTSGSYERIGGVIRRVDNGQIVTWLRNVDGVPVESGMLGNLGPLTQLMTATTLLNLSIASVGFVIVLRRLDVIEQRLASLAKEIQGVNRKLDLSFYVNFRAALELARSAFEMRNENNRRTTATQAINRFLEAEQHYLSLLDLEFEAGGWANFSIINTLILAYVSTVRCYLQLNEVDTAVRHLEEGNRVLNPYVHRFFNSVIAVNPAIYLHPQLASTISLKRLTQLLRHWDGSLSEAMVFENLRTSIWETANQDTNVWLQKLPLALWNQETDGERRTGIFRRNVSKDEALSKLIPRLPEAFAQVEQVQEATRYVKGFQLELEYLLTSAISFDEWQRLPIPTLLPTDSFIFLLPQGSELI